MMPKSVARKLIPLEAWEAEQMTDPEFVAARAELEPAYQVARLRILRGLTQEQLADLVGTKQPSIARLESGAAAPSLSFLRRVAAALDSRVEIHFVPLEAAAGGDQASASYSRSQWEVHSAALREERMPYEGSED